MGACPRCWVPPQILRYYGLPLSANDSCEHGAEADR